MSIKIGSIEIPSHLGHSLRPQIIPILARTLRRSLNGNLTIQSRYQKLQATISGEGWFPPGLDGLDFGLEHEVHWIQTLSKSSISNVITIPRSFRTDLNYEPKGLAIVDGVPYDVDISLVGDIATLSTIVSATQYVVIYYPIIIGALSISTSYDEDSDTHSWSLEIEEK